VRHFCGGIYCSMCVHKKPPAKRTKRVQDRDA
jgi:hypothetical protein